MPLASKSRARREWMLSLAWVLLGTIVRGQEAGAPPSSSATDWEHYDWLRPSSGLTVPGSTLTYTSGQNVGDPFAVVTNGSLWQQNYGAVYTQPIAGSLAFSYETDDVTLNESSLATSPTDGTPDDLSHTQKAGLQFQPVQQVTWAGNIHDTLDDATSPDDAVETRGGAFTAENHLPLDSILTLGLNFDTTTTGMIGGSTSGDTAYDAQLKKPLGKLPLTAVVTGHYEETSQNGAAASRLPSLDQSLVWKPMDTTTVEMGLRQQHYQEFPGVTNELNEAVFADWSQSVLPDITWHSYAEVLNSRGTENLAPASPATSGANGTAQSNDPTNSMAMPTSLSDETLTFSTGPSFKLDRDVSASIEYSSRIDRSPLPGDVGQEQRVSISLKGSF